MNGWGTAETGAESHVLALQQSVGNQAVARMMEANRIQRGFGKKLTNLIKGKKRGPKDHRSEASKAHDAIFAGNDPVTGHPWTHIAGPDLAKILIHDWGIPPGGMGASMNILWELRADWVPKKETMTWVLEKEAGDPGWADFLGRFFVHKGWMTKAEVAALKKAG